MPIKCNQIDQEYSDKLNLPTALSKNFPSLKKTGSAHHAYQNNLNCNWLRIFGQAQNPNCIKQEFSITKANRQFTSCVPSKTICNPINQQYLQKLKIPTALFKNFPQRNNKDSAHHVCLTKQSAIQLIKNIWTSSKFQLPRARIFHHERKQAVHTLSLIHIWRCRRSYACRSRWSPYH